MQLDRARRARGRRVGRLPARAGAPVPGRAEDCYAATAWAVEHAADLGRRRRPARGDGRQRRRQPGRGRRLMARDRGGPPIAFQVLIYPSVDLVNSYPSEDENEFAPILAKADLHAHEHVLPGTRERAVRVAAVRRARGPAAGADPDRPARPAARPGPGLRRRAAGRRGGGAADATTSTPCTATSRCPASSRRRGRPWPRRSRRCARALAVRWPGSPGFPGTQGSGVALKMAEQVCGLDME